MPGCCILFSGSATKPERAAFRTEPWRLWDQTAVDVRLYKSESADHPQACTLGAHSPGVPGGDLKFGNLACSVTGALPFHPGGSSSVMGLT